MSKCGKCDSDISFMSVLNTPNPFKLKCSSCKAPISLSLVSAGIVASIILAVISAILIYFYGSEGYWIKVVLPTVLAAEGLYFAAIRMELVKVKPEKAA
ncbi:MULTISPECIES: hypothetical protein [unclassified Pseudoalteromonas]|uniref:hypothetical protein n=1 Tax=unclassified Pseudoalteromonas TaxID=194690 RepID=UPI0020972D6B|nr:hypothetical protein [Pseudoalteromonas sp. XMcav2-N]MCO7190423.1 hypothetical protein [Pseudoalteromonas sp. XMcav2-N]